MENYTEEEKKEMRRHVLATKKLGRTAIILHAGQEISDAPESLIEDPNTYISVWYNELLIKVEFKSLSSITYIPYHSSCYVNTSVRIAPNGASSIGGTPISSPKEYDDYFQKKYLYQSTIEIEAAIDTFLGLHNSNTQVNAIDKATFQGTMIIREHPEYYDIELGDSYPITYKINKESGKVYDYHDPYGDHFFPTPTTPTHITPLGGEWIELKEY